MAKFTQWVQSKKTRKWVYIIGGIGFVVVLFLLLRGGARSGATGGGAVAQAGPSEAQLAANLESQAIQTQFAAAAMQTQAALEAEKLHAANEALSVNAQLQALNIQAQAADREGERALESNIASIQAEREIALQGISSQQLMHQATIEAGVARERIAAESVIAQQQLFTQGQVELERARSSVGIASVEAQKEIEIARQNTLQFGISRAKKKHVASIVGGQESKGFGFSLGPLSFGVSDIRRKRNINPIGARIDGIPTYSYELAGAPGLQAGVIAQELELMAPQFVLHTPRGVLVDYIGLDASA